MESVDRGKIVRAVYPALLRLHQDGTDAAAVSAAVAASAEGYPFPTNLDLDPPIGGLTPLSQAEIVVRALSEGWDAAWLDAALTAYDGRRSNAAIR